jgi:tetratricopeptide (TPR) repeat protein
MHTLTANITPKNTTTIAKPPHYSLTCAHICSSVVLAVDERKVLEVEAIRLAEEKRYEEALQRLTAAVKVSPSHPSPYNNRAQVLRLMGGKDRLGEALQDLAKAIELGEAFLLTDDRPDSSEVKALAQALTQRTVVYRRAGDLAVGS